MLLEAGVWWTIGELCKDGIVAQPLGLDRRSVSGGARSVRQKSERLLQKILGRRNGKIEKYFGRSRLPQY